MGCSTSSQTSAVDPTRPSTKPEEFNGASTTGTANENGKVAEDSETIPDQTPAQGGSDKPVEEPAATASSAGEEPQAAPPVQDAAPADASAAATAAEGGADTAASSSEPAPVAPEQEKAEATAADPEPKTEEAPAPSE